MTPLRLAALIGLVLIAGCEDPLSSARQAFAAHYSQCDKDSIKWQRSPDGQTFTVICEAKKK